ncbi:hypothetical protein [Ilumatobacter sp.]|uniref:hypothetical protein n=1 Tax=Ilumatobacter sp. TaxID=1967498 RepID=UPI003753B02D
MITNEAQYRSNKEHLARFSAAATKLEQLELDAVRSKADDLRAELSEFERRQIGEPCPAL